MVKEGYNSITLDEETMEILKMVQTKRGYKTIPETIRALANLTESKILYKINLLQSLVNPEVQPFSYLMLEIDASEEQEKAVFDLMDKTEKAIISGGKVISSQFENEIYKIFPRNYGDYHLAESIVGVLGTRGRWEKVYKFMKKNGMNL